MLRSQASKTPLLNSGVESEKRKEIKQYFNQTLEQYESLFRVIRRDDAYYLRAEPLRHPLIFYFGHTATFFINKCVLAKLLNQRINPQFESMFAIGVDEMSWDDLDERHYDWPTVDAVIHYRKQVKEIINSIIDTMPITFPIQQEDPAWVILMGIEHERIHLETSAVIIRMLPLDEVQPHPEWAPCKDAGTPPNNALISIASQTITLGKPQHDATYGWDNEYGEKTVSIKPFKVSQTLVSNQAFMEFIQDGGYHSTQFWTEEGRQWLAYSKATLPKFWLKRDKHFYQRNLTDEVPLPLDWPVEVNYLEAKAFCNWMSEKTAKHIRLPTEAEWYVLRNTIETDQPLWQQAPGNINLEYYASSCPVNRFATTLGNQPPSNENQLFDIIGNVWQWTESPIDGFPGFKVHPLYDDFSTPTFDNQHNLIKGGSWISTGNESLKHSRYAFRRHFFQHAGFRYIESEEETTPMEPVNTYETDELVSQYLEFHYGDRYFDTDNFPAACIKRCMNAMDNHPTNRALDLGCAVGRSSFELAKHFTHVDGIDFSARFIQCGFQLAETGHIKYTITTEGQLVDYRDIYLNDIGCQNLGDKVHFAQGDAINLKPRYSGYDLIFSGNLIDRLYNPKHFLQTIAERLNAGGRLILTSPYTWLAEYTDPENWIGGYKVNGENLSTFDGLNEILSPYFECISREDIPFVIRETQRKFQHSIAEMTVWRKK